MQFLFTLMNEKEARAILAWHYDGPYAVYNMHSDNSASLTEFLDRRSPYYAVHDEQEQIVGFFSFGTSSMVEGYDEPALYLKERTLTIGCGMRPDLTGQGLGLSFVQAGLEFAKKSFTPDRFRLFVYRWNTRAIRVYERAGFQHAGILVRPEDHGEGKFLEMSRDLDH